ncbi:CPBP family intramembrane metalloprotease [Rhodococcus sp. ACS1]|uniref:CPBP family intramembrane glutamic endopeptidase n=1 Tax=Rhodococcus sp. ACS1 TaxID=2028570 RepID=UPI000BB0DFBF|nr:CPBP family intramembrane glutamic endopeptidase [Rhodococcus sp. ACS1]PBC52489.1 CPBP family intramembrane metalloprotease [Rhodococcus sp. ACS1]
MTIRRCRRAYLAGEYVLLFFGLASIYAVLFRGTSPIPFLLVLGLAVVVYLRRSSGFDRASLWRPGTFRSQARSIAALWCLAAVCLSVTVALLRPGLLFAFPREDPLIWALVMVLYPLLSVYPQELIFRWFVFHRYATVFGEGARMVAASSVAFGFVHIAFGSWITVVMTIVGGWIFASRYRRTRSLFTVSVEHALYGMLVFTVGLGQYFYHGAAGA